MEILDQTYIRDLVDYSFGDQSGAHLEGGYMKTANRSNFEFFEKLDSVKKSGKKFMTLFIDNIRLYYRPNAKLTSMELHNNDSKAFKYSRLQELSHNDLLQLCSEIEDMNFLIFTGFEDTPTDELIFERIPQNVLGIYASNATTFGGKVHPIPYGLQRKLSSDDNRHNILRKFINVNVEPQKKLYINHNTFTNPERSEINNFFLNFDWVSVGHPSNYGEIAYENYLMEIKNHKFMICAQGNAIDCDCHRDWEVLYMRRVPVLKKNKYLEKIFDGFPVLFVDSFFDITEEFLDENNHLYESMKTLDFSKLDISIMYKKILEKYDFSNS